MPAVPLLYCNLVNDLHGDQSDFNHHIVVDSRFQRAYAAGSGKDRVSIHDWSPGYLVHDLHGGARATLITTSLWTPVPSVPRMPQGSHRPGPAYMSGLQCLGVLSSSGL